MEFASKHNQLASKENIYFDNVQLRTNQMTKTQDAELSFYDKCYDFETWWDKRYDER